MTLSKRSRRIVEEMGIGPVWLTRARTEGKAGPTEVGQIEAEQIEEGARTEAEARPVETAAAFADARYDPAAIATMDWPALRDTVSGCVKCQLCESRTRTVFGTGDERATWMFIGEGPGRNEDREGEPFIGQAGKLLDNMLAALGVARGNGHGAYIANVVKCRPTDDNGRDRPPTREEADACLPYLKRQIALVRPSVLVALGKTAAISLLELDPDTPVGRLRGTVHRYDGLPLVVTYHPAYLLRKLSEKGKAWSDLCLAAEALSHAARERS